MIKNVSDKQQNDWPTGMSLSCETLSSSLRQRDRALLTYLGDVKTLSSQMQTTRIKQKKARPRGPGGVRKNDNSLAIDRPLAIFQLRIRQSSLGANRRQHRPGQQASKTEGIRIRKRQGL